MSTIRNRQASSFDSLAWRYADIRGATEQLAAPLSAEDCALQSMPDASPIKWHLAHTSWFFETFILERALSDYRHFHPAYRSLFNSYYVMVGPAHPRPERGLLSRPTLAEVLAYRKHVDACIHALLDDGRAVGNTILELVELGLHHEQQHQELMLTDLKHLFFCNPLWPAYRDRPPIVADAATALGWRSFGEGVREIGHPGEGFAFDNERPRHRVFLPAYALAMRLVTNAEYMAFIEDGGYRCPDLWLAEGWDTVCRCGWTAPLYWQRRDGNWRQFTLAGARPVYPHEPVCHVSYFEADAYARWAGCRLPTEAEWEIAAGAAAREGNFVDSGALHPLAVARRATAEPLQQLYGDVWEWTQSAYTAYPGFRPAAGAVGEYNGKFMCNQFVLRGGSCVTPRSHIRASYRNFFAPAARWQFSGIRLARDGA